MNDKKRNNDPLDYSERPYGERKSERPISEKKPQEEKLLKENKSDESDRPKYRQ